MAEADSDIVLDGHQQTLFDEMCHLIDAVTDGLELMTRTQDLVGMLLKRASDGPLRDQSLGEISRFFLGVMRASDLSSEYRMRRLKMFSKATIKIMIAQRTGLHGQDHAPPPNGIERRTRKA